METERDPQSGQAAVEAALTLPLVLFLVLGTLQLFMLLQARMMTEYAVFRAVRVGSVNHGSCVRMRHAAVAALLPTLARTDDYRRLAAAFERYRDDTSLVTLEKEYSRPFAGEEDQDFDNPDVPPMRVTGRLVFWAPLRIPFVNWVMTTMFLAHWNELTYRAVNPLLPADRDANWPGQGDAISMRYSTEVLARYRRSPPEYVLPLVAVYSMRMMTPAKAANGMGCP